jgi:heme/copper-type cytochrome/quinol oxidase subunit 3
MTHAAVAEQLPIGNRWTRSPGWWAMVWTIATEASLFAFLLFSYFYTASQARGAWPPDGPLALKLSLPNTVILIVSSFTYMWAERGIKRGNQGQLRLGLFITFVLGVVFVVIQGIEWSHQGFGPSSHAFGALFYTVTGFHGAHVIVGLLLNLVVQIWAWMGAFTEDRHLGVTNAGMYWHFVDIVWLVVFSSLYLSPRLS